MKRRGFTLIELLIVIVIMGVLAAFISTNLFGARERAGDTQKKSNLNQLKIALQLYYTSFHQYPPAGSGLSFAACGVDGNTNCTDSFTNGTVVFMDKLPKNSGGQYEFRYYQCNNQDDFRLKINLTNASDPDISTSQVRCPASTCLGTSLSFGPTDYVLCGD